METKHLTRLGHPVFLISVAALIINDWILKSSFHNVLTGKLSDVAGLIAFPFFFSVLFSRHRLGIHLATAVLFVWWKSEWSQPLINLLNAQHIAVHRVVDVTDNIALVSIFISWSIRDSDVRLFSGRAIPMMIAIVSFAAFVATSMPKGTREKYSNINKHYDFAVSKRELVGRFNALQAKEVYTISKMYGARTDFDKATGTFRYPETGDTLAILLDPLSADTLFYKSSFATMLIVGDNEKSSIILLSVTGFRREGKKKDVKTSMIKFFERYVVRRLKKKFPDTTPHKL